MKLDSGPPQPGLEQFMANEARFGILKNLSPHRAKTLLESAEAPIHKRYSWYERMTVKSVPAESNLPKN